MKIIAAIGIAVGLIILLVVGNALGVFLKLCFDKWGWFENNKVWRLLLSIFIILVLVIYKFILS